MSYKKQPVHTENTHSLFPEVNYGQQLPVMPQPRHPSEYSKQSQHTIVSSYTLHILSDQNETYVASSSALISV